MNNENDRFFLNTVFVLIIFIPLALILGTFSINLIVYSLAVLILFKAFLSKNWNFLKSDLCVILFIMWAYLLLISVFIHEYSIKNIYKSFAFGFNFIFCLGIAFYLKKISSKKIIFFSYILLLITIFIYIDLTYQFLNPEFRDIFGFKVNTIRSYEVFGAEKILPLRLSGPFEGELVAGFYLATIGYASIFLFYYKSNFLKEKKYLIILLFINFCFIILTGERSSTIMSIITLSIFLVFDSKFNFKKLKYLFLIGVILVSFIIISPTTKERMNDLKDWSNREDNIYSSFLQTPWGKHYKTSIILIKQKPLLGTGIRTFRIACNQNNISGKYNLSDGCSTHPHNYILEILVEVGIIFVILFIYLIYKVIKIYSKKFNYLTHGFLAIFLSYIFPLRPTGAFFSSWHGSFFWILLALIIFSMEKESKNNEIKLNN